MPTPSELQELSDAVASARDALAGDMEDLKMATEYLCDLLAEMQLA